MHERMNVLPAVRVLLPRLDVHDARVLARATFTAAVAIAQSIGESLPAVLAVQPGRLGRLPALRVERERDEDELIEAQPAERRLDARRVARVDLGRAARAAP